MIYKGYTIIHDKVRGWLVRVDITEEWLATSKEDAMMQVDGHISCSLRHVA